MDVSTMAANDFTCDKQSQSGSRLLFRVCRWLEAGEFFEQIIYLIGWDTRTVISDVEIGFPVAPLPR